MKMTPCGWMKTSTSSKLRTIPRNSPRFTKKVNTVHATWSPWELGRRWSSLQRTFSKGYPQRSTLPNRSMRPDRASKPRSRVISICRRWMRRFWRFRTRSSCSALHSPIMGTTISFSKSSNSSSWSCRTSRIFRTNKWWSTMGSTSLRTNSSSRAHRATSLIPLLLISNSSSLSKTLAPPAILITT